MTELPTAAPRRFSVAALGVVALATAAATTGVLFLLDRGIPGGPSSAKIERVAAASLGTIVAEAPPALADGPVRNVILLLGDGMAGSQIAAGRIHARGVSGRLHLERLPVTGLVLTHSAGGEVARSDAAATALSTGRKTRNGRIGTDSAGHPLPTIVEVLAAAGWATGLVTTTRITDATPAAFAAHVAERTQQAEIARQLASSKVDLLAGGGRDIFLPVGEGGGSRTDGRDLIAEARSRGVSVVADADGWARATTLPLFAIFPIEPQKSEPRAPSVGALAGRAIALLAASGRPFFLMVEDEEIDSAAHGNDIRRLAATLERFDEAVRRATEFAARDGATLVVVTGDHSTGGPSIDQESSDRGLVVSWESTHHTGEPVPVFAYGPPSAAAPFTGVHDNIEIPALIAGALGVSFPPPPSPESGR